MKRKRSLTLLACSIFLIAALLCVGTNEVNAYEYDEHMVPAVAPPDEYCTNLELGSNNTLVFSGEEDTKRFKFTAPKAGRYILWDNTPAPEYDEDDQLLNGSVMKVSWTRFIWHKTDTGNIKAISLKRYNRDCVNPNSGGAYFDVENAGDIFYLSFEASGDEDTVYGPVTFTLQEQEWYEKPNAGEYIEIKHNDFSELSLKPEIVIIDGKSPSLSYHWDKYYNEEERIDAGSDPELSVDFSENIDEYRCIVQDSVTGQRITQYFRLRHVFDDSIPDDPEQITENSPVEITGANNGETATFLFSPQATGLYAIAGGDNEDVGFSLRVLEAKQPLPEVIDAEDDEDDEDDEDGGADVFKMDAGKNYYIQVHRCEAGQGAFSFTISKKHKHEYEEVAGSAVAATCTTEGKTADRQCTVCKDVIKGTVIPAKGHAYEEVAGTARAATYTAEGKKADRKCSRCGKTIIGDAIPKLTADSGKKDETKTTVGSEHVLKGGGKSVITGSATAKLTKAPNNRNVIVPDSFNEGGKTFKVTEIGQDAFTGSKIRNVTLGKNIKKIRPKAFNKSKVKTITIKSKKLTKKNVKNALKGSKVSTVKVKVGSKKENKKYVKKYKKFFTKANAGRKVTVK